MPYLFNKKLSDSLHDVYKNSGYFFMIVGYFMIFSTDVETNRRILSYNSEDTLMMLVHPSAKDILGPTNLAF